MTFKKLLKGSLTFYILAIAGIYTLQKYIIFQPKKLDKDFEFVFENPFEEFFLNTSDETELHLLLFKTQLPRKGLVLYFHGNADNLQRWGHFHADFTSRGYDILMMDYRGFGKSTGTPDEAIFYQDARLVYDWVLEKYDAAEIIIFGRSLGCAVAAQLATQVDTRMVILETPFFNFKNLFQTQGRILIFPFDFKYKFPNNEFLAKIKKPIYIFAGTKDWVVPNASTEKLKPLLKPIDRYFEIEGGGHKNLNTFEKYHEALDLILK